MTDIEKKCIDWGRDRGLFQGGSLIHCWRTQFIKLLQDPEQLGSFLKSHLKKVFVDSMVGTNISFLLNF